MKLLKLILVFAVILAAVVGAFFLMNGGSGITPPPEGNDYEMYSKQFAADWEQAGDWNEKLFRQNCETVRQLSTEYSKESTQTLGDINTVRATVIVYEKIFAEWAKPACRFDVVKKYRDAVNVITEEDPKASSDKNITMIKDVYATYTEARALAGKAIGLSPSFNGTSWSPSFSAYSNGITHRRTAILGNANYKKYLSDISEIKNGLAAIPGKLSEARERYYNVLAQRIISYYDNVERTSSNNSDLRAVYARYRNERGSDHSALHNFVVRFTNEVDEKNMSAKAPVYARNMSTGADR